MFLQIGVLLLQDLFGPTFFLPNQMAKPSGYDYHPSIPLPDPEAPEQTLGDCAICMDTIEVDASLRQRSGVDDEKSSSGFGRSGALWAQAGVRKSYSLAPCHHLFVCDVYLVVMLRGLLMMYYADCWTIAHIMFGKGKFISSLVRMMYLTRSCMNYSGSLSRWEFMLCFWSTELMPI